MTNSETRPARQQIIKGLNEKSQLKNKVYLQTLEVFNLTKEVLHEMSNDINELLEDGENRRVRFEYRDRGKFEAELKFADDILLFSMHTDIFQFDRDHPVWKNEYAKKEPFSTYCGGISVYNFLTDSFKYNRKDASFWWPRYSSTRKVALPKATANTRSAFGKRTIDKNAIVNVVETAVCTVFHLTCWLPPLKLLPLPLCKTMNAKLTVPKCRRASTGFAFVPMM